MIGPDVNAASLAFMSVLASSLQLRRPVINWIVTFNLGEILFMKHVHVKPTSRLHGNIQALSSKNYTTRYLLAAALAEGTSTVYYPAHSEDSDAMRRCIRDLGAIIEE